MGKAGCRISNLWKCSASRYLYISLKIAASAMMLLIFFLGQLMPLKIFVFKCIHLNAYEEV
jgi:hypothetical protein